MQMVLQRESAQRRSVFLIISPWKQSRAVPGCTGGLQTEHADRHRDIDTQIHAEIHILNQSQPHISIRGITNENSASIMTPVNKESQ